SGLIKGNVFHDLRTVTNFRRLVAISISHGTHNNIPVEGCMPHNIQVEGNIFQMPEGVKYQKYFLGKAENITIDGKLVPETKAQRPAPLPLPFLIPMDTEGKLGIRERRPVSSSTVNHKEFLRSKSEFNIAYHLCSDPDAGLELNVTEQELDEDFERIKAIGFTHVTLWAGSVLNEDIGNVKLMKLAVRKAAQHGLGCYIWFWTAGKPLMYGQPGWDAPPIVDKSGERVKYMNIWDETWRSGFLREYLNWLGRTFRVFPNVAGYVVDEPFGSWWKWEEYGYDARTKQQFILWLQRKYGDIKKLNQAWNTDYKTWAQIAPPKQGTMKIPNWRDWTEVRQQFSVDWVADINRCLKKAHPGCRIVWSITRRYVDNARADELANCLDWQRIVPQFDAILMAKFPTRKGQDQFVPFTQEVLSGLSRKPEAAYVDKIYAIVLWESGWVSKIEPRVLKEVLDLVASHDYDLYVWAWQGVNHLEAWDDLQAVLREFIREQKAKQICPRSSVVQLLRNAER
ncbi:MAG: beta-galactosidase, partial [Planctomycetota bacterium]|nr:beta-galactosidase [Planctomycetota bacterium]